MELNYGQGRYIEGMSDISGEIVLQEQKICLRDQDAAELTSTFIPLDNIKRFKEIKGGLEISVEQTVMTKYTAKLLGNPQEMKSLIKALVLGRSFKKKLLTREWVASDLA